MDAPQDRFHHKRKAAQERLRQEQGEPMSEAEEGGPRGLRYYARPLYDINPEWEKPAPRRGLLMRRPGRDEDGDQIAMPRGELVMINGAAGIGKSWLTLQLAATVAMGIHTNEHRNTNPRWLDTFTVVPELEADNPAVVYIGAEDSQDEIERRLWIYLQHHKHPELLVEVCRRRLIALGLGGAEGDAWPPLAMMPPSYATGADGAEEATGARYTSPFLEELKDILREGKGGEPYHVPLIVIDPLSAILPEEAEQDAHTATAALAELASLASLPGNPTVVVVHHSRKGSNGAGGWHQDAARGSSGITARVRQQWNFYDAADNPKAEEKPPEDLRLAMAKSNYTPSCADVYLRRIPNGPLVWSSEQNKNAKPEFDQ